MRKEHIILGKGVSPETRRRFKDIIDKKVFKYFESDDEKEKQKIAEEIL